MDEIEEIMEEDESPPVEITEDLRIVFAFNRMFQILLEERPLSINKIAIYYDSILEFVGCLKTQLVINDRIDTITPKELERGEAIPVISHMMESELPQYYTGADVLERLENAFRAVLANEALSQKVPALRRIFSINRDTNRIILRFT